MVMGTAGPAQIRRGRGTARLGPGAIKGLPAFGIPEHFPGCIEGQHLLIVAAGIGMVLLHQLAIGRFDLSVAGGAADTEHGIGVAHSWPSLRAGSCEPALNIG